MAKAKKIFKIDLEKSLMLRVQGEAGKYNTMPWLMLREVGDTLQDLLKTIAISEISEDEGIDLENFNIELSGFYEGSAVPVFKLTPRVKAVIGDVSHQRKEVSRTFSRLMDIANSGDYASIKRSTHSTMVTNNLVDKTFKFVNSFGNAPVEIVNKKGKGFTSIYKIQSFNKDLKDRLISKPTAKEEKENELTINGVATVKITRNTKGKLVRKIYDLYTKKEATLSFAPDIINIPGKQYILEYPLPSSLRKIDGYYVIECEMLDITASGQTDDEAEEAFYREFDYLYTRYNELSDSQLSPRLQKIKLRINLLVKHVILQ